MNRSMMTILGLSLVLSLVPASSGYGQFVDPMVFLAQAALKFREDFEPRFYRSGSMAPTLQSNDRLLIDKQTYRKEAPKRGDLIIFNPTEAIKKVKGGLSDPFIKRVIGLPGETIKVEAGKVYINNRPLSEPYISEPPTFGQPSVKIPANSYFVLGDNRNDSFDSRYWGFVTRSLIFGKVVGIYCPIDRQRILDQAKPLKLENQETLAWTQQMAKDTPAICNFKQQ